jgi:hypothetical protein
MDIFWNRFKIHYKQAVRKLDVYLNNTLIAEEVTMPNGRYDPDYIQIQSIGAGKDWFAKIEFAGAIANTRSLTFGHEWVRSHPLTVIALVGRNNALEDAMYRKCNFTSVFGWNNDVETIEKAHSLLAVAFQASGNCSSDVLLK